MHDPDSYDSYSQFQRRDAMELVPYIVSQMAPISERSTILDFGCGSGYNTRNIILTELDHLGTSSSTCKIYAVDVSQKMVDFAAARYDHPNLSYMVADITKDDCEFSCDFDKIFSLHVMHWINDHRKALRSMHRLLKVRGEIGFYYISNAAVFHVYEKMSQMEQWESVMKDVKNFIPKSYYSLDPADDMRTLMTSIGFQVQEALNLRRKFLFDSFQNMIEAAMAANPFIYRIPEIQRDEYKRHFSQCFMPFVQNTPTEANPEAIEVEYSIVLVRASKM